MRKTLFLFLCSALILVGCSSEDMVNCEKCGTTLPESTIVLTTADVRMCSACLHKREHNRCLSCGEYYEPDSWAVDGYCIGCSEVEAWGCSGCEDQQSLDDLAEVEPGYYLCADCLLDLLREYTDDDFHMDEWSPYISREDAMK